jgi:hypothetical protein
MAATDGVADDEQGLASGLVNTSFQLGGALVLAIVAAVVAGGGRTQSAASLLHSYHVGLGVVAGISLLGFAAVTSSLVGRRAPAAEPVEVEVVFEEAA